MIFNYIYTPALGIVLGFSSLYNETFKMWALYFMTLAVCGLLTTNTTIKKRTVREKIMENEKKSRSGKSQGILFLVSEI